MAISLNNHEGRIAALENKQSGSIFPDYNRSVKLANSATNYKPPSNGFISFDLYDNSGSVCWLSINGTKYFSGDDYGGLNQEGTISGFFPITTSDTVSWVNNGIDSSGVGVFFIPSKILTIYYIVRYNIYKLVRFLSHLDTKFGGERR